MKIYSAIILTSFLLICSSCSFFETAPAEPEKAAETAGSNTADDTNPEDSADAGAEAPETSEALSKDAKASRTEIEAKDAAETGLGPTDTLRAFNDAAVRKDAARIKSFLSRGSLKMIEESAREKRTTVDRILTSDDGAPMPSERDMRNEIIDGNSATVEVKNSVLGNYDKMILVKENGNWRVALDKFRDEMLRKINQSQKNPPGTNTN